MAQWWSAWLETEGPRVRALPASLRCGPWARHIYPSLVLVQSRKTRPCITERLLMGRKESNQTNKWSIHKTSANYISWRQGQRQHSMILFKIKETAHINSGGVLLSFGSHVMMALTQENVHYTLNSGLGVMNKSNRVHVRIQEFLSGGGGGMGSRLDGQKTVWTMFFLVINLFYSLRSVSNGFITEGRRGSNFFQGVGVSIETHITCDFPEEGGGSGPPNPPLLCLTESWSIKI